MSVWDAIVGQRPTIDLLKRTVAAQAQGHDEVPQISQDCATSSWPWA